MRATLNLLVRGAMRLFLRLLLVLAVAASVALVQPSSAEARMLDRLVTSTGRPLAVPVPEAVGIPNFAELQAGLARGGQPSKEGIEFLRQKGYRTIISLRSNPAEREMALRSGMEYFEIPMRADVFGATRPTEEQVRFFLSIVSDASRRPVFFHCRRGKDRTGAMAAIYRIEEFGWTADEAIEEMRAFGFSRHYRELMRFVRDYSREWRAGCAAPVCPRAAGS